MKVDDEKESGKYDEEKDSGKYDDDEEVIDVTELDISPNDCAVDEELRLEVSFTPRRPLRGAHWSVSVVFDTIDKRQIVDLGSTAATDYVGPSLFCFHVDRINVDGIEPSVLANCGLLVAALHVGTTELVKINMVVQISQHGDRFTRTVYNPLG